MKSIHLMLAVELTDWGIGMMSRLKWSKQCSEELVMQSKEKFLLNGEMYNLFLR